MTLEEFRDLAVPEWTEAFKKLNQGWIKPKIQDRNWIESYDWTTGGDDGGSCWDTGDRRSSPVTGEREPEFTQLNDLLEQVAPAITFLQFRKIEAIIEQDSWTNHEYYGNYYCKAKKKVSVEALYNLLKGMGYV